MAGVGFAIQCTNTQIQAAGTLSLVQVLAAANHRIKLTSVTANADGTTANDPPVILQLLRQTDAGTASALTPVKLNSADDETLQVTAQDVFTLEPTPGNIIYEATMHVQGQVWEVPPGLLRDLVIPGAGRIGVRCITPAGITGTVSCVVSISGEE